MLTIIADNTVSFVFFLTCLAVHYCFLIWQINAFLSSTLNAMYIRALLSVFIVFTAVSFLVELTNALAKHGDLGCIWRVWRIWHIWCAQRCKARGRSRCFVQQSFTVICNFWGENGRTIIRPISVPLQQHRRSDSCCTIFAFIGLDQIPLFS